MSIRFVFAMLCTAASAALALASAHAQQPQVPQPSPSLRLYVLDCGIINATDVEQTYGLKRSEMATTKMVTPCFLIVHPRGSMIWDTGEIPDSAVLEGAVGNLAGIPDHASARMHDQEAGGDHLRGRHLARLQAVRLLDIGGVDDAAVENIEAQ